MPHAQTHRILEKFNMQNCKPAEVLVIKGDKFSMDQCHRNEVEQAEMNDKPFASALESLLYAQVWSDYILFS